MTQPDLSRFALPLALVLALAPRAVAAQDAAARAEAEATAAEAPAEEAARPSMRERLAQMAGSAEEGAATWQLVPAVLLSYGAGATDNFGAGASLRLDHMPNGLPLRFGGFATAEVLADGTVRLAGGLQGGLTFMGCQMGLAYRSGTDLFAGSLGLQIGKTFDMGGFSIGGRMTFPLVDFLDPNGGVTRTQGIEGQVFITIGAALGLDGTPRRRSCGCHRGRGADAPAAIEEGVEEAAAPN